jgi:hypothetical protein
MRKRKMRKMKYSSLLSKLSSLLSFSIISYFLKSCGNSNTSLEYMMSEVSRINQSKLSL